jgi:hypothetical protein
MRLFGSRVKPSFEKALETIPLNDSQKIILKERYTPVVRDLESRCRRLASFFHISRLFVTVGSLIVPALLSIQYTNTGPHTMINDPGTFAYRIYWATWVISLLVTTSNGILSVFKIDKKYYFLHTTLEQLKSEGWQYLQLSGRYSGFHNPGVTPSHNNQFIFFCHAVEKIKMKQVEEEYYKLAEPHNNASGQTITKSQAGSNGQNGDTNLPSDKREGILPPTPLNSLVEQAAQLSPELLQQIYEMAVKQPRVATKNLVETIDGEAKKGNAATAPAVLENTESGTNNSATVPVSPVVP